MPELPEVHTIVVDLNENISGYKILDVLIKSAYKTIPNNTTFKRALVGKTVVDVYRIAKNIVVRLSSGNYVLIHLAMTGRVLLKDASGKPNGGTCVMIKMEKNGNIKELRFADTRMFGKIGVIGEKSLQTLFNKYGPEPIDPSLTVKHFHRIIKSKRTNIKNVLLDQSLVSGLGNIYATESLFISGINPQTNTSKITLDMAKKLLDSARLVIKEGIKNRGSTLPDKAYVDIFGKEGSQQKHFRIYMKEKCPKCDSGVKFIKLNGRGTYFCENCQPLETAPLFK
jgi:formamidopyrimidine-DNA glycosylase